MYFLITAISHRSSLDTVFGFVLILSAVDAQEFLCSTLTPTASLLFATEPQGWVPTADGDLQEGLYFLSVFTVSGMCNMKNSIVTTPQTLSTFRVLAIHNIPPCPCRRGSQNLK